MAGQYVMGADPVLDRVKQGHLQIASLDCVLWPRIAGGASAGLRPDKLAEFVVIAECGRLDRSFRQDLAETELDQLACRVWLQIDAKAESLHFGDRLVNPYIDARGMQAKRSSKPTNAGADHCDVHDCP